jgi:ribosome biogenesis GTPase
MHYTLEELGFTTYFKELYASYQTQEFSIARVALENKNRFVLLTENGMLSGEVTGKLLFTAETASDLPKVGDWVIVTVFEQENKAVIHEILPRRNLFFEEGNWQPIR